MAAGAVGVMLRTPCGVCRCSLRLAGGGTRVRGWVREGGCGCGAEGSVGEVSRPAPGVGAGLVVRAGCGEGRGGLPQGEGCPDRGVWGCARWESVGGVML